MKNLKIHLYYGLSLIVIGGLALFYKSGGGERIAVENRAAAAATITETNPIKLTSIKGYSFIQPLLRANQESETAEFASLKARIQNVIGENQNGGGLSTSSVYLYSLADGKWMYINPSESYHPGSLMKMPMLMTWLKEADVNPSLLDKRYTYTGDMKVPAQTFTSTMMLQNGQSYSVRDLLKYMAAYSDNRATRILNENADLKDFLKTFTDLNMGEPDVHDRNYAVSAKEISEYFIVLYYATYISRRNSEYAMQLLSECDFKEGMVKELPQNVKVAHKFGEWGGNRVNAHEMHEAGVVYLQGKPYLLTIATKGTNSKDLAAIISRISKAVYDELSAAPHA